jgi:serine/threonine protein kinase/WD40 repeat protein
MKKADPMTTSSSGREPLEKLAEEFAERYRRGERPALSEYTARYPELAAEIRELFPALVEMEQLASVGGAPTGSFGAGNLGSDAAPRQLGDYRILGMIGHGAMGVVYEAVQESLGRHVALKVLPLHGLLNPNLLERFKREARAAARLHHTNIVPVFGVGEDGGVHYYAMQFIRGQGLDKVLEEVRRLRDHSATPVAAASQRSLSGSVAEGLLSGQFAGANPAEAATIAPSAALQALPPSSSSSAGGGSQLSSLTESQYFRSVARAGAQVAEALEYAHRQGVLHRDVKPSNLLLDTLGTVWVTDFGLAKLDDSDGLTNPGDLLGTMRFMAPERFEGKCDARGEVYSLGVTLYEMATLRPVFTATDRLELLEQVRCGTVVPPRQIDPRIPRDLETVILKAMARDPADRYPTAAALAEDLRRFLADEPIRARRTSAAERLQRWCRRNPLVASLVAAVVLVTALGFAGTLLQMREARQQRDDAQQANATLQQTSDELQATLYGARLNLVPAAWEAGNVRHVLDVLEQTKPAAGETDRRGFEWHYWNRLCHAETRSLKIAPSFLAPAFSGDGTRIADVHIEESGKELHLWLTVWDTATGAEQLRKKILVLVRPEGYRAANAVVFTEHVQLSRDGSRVAVLPPQQLVVSSDPLQVWDVAAGKKIAEFPRPEIFVLSQDGDRVVLAYQKEKAERAEIRAADGGGKPVDLDLKGRHLDGLAFSPDSMRLAGWWIPVDPWEFTEKLPGAVWVWDAATGERRSTFQWTGGAWGSVAFTPDGSRLAVTTWGDGDGTPPSMVLVDARTGKEVHRVAMNRSALGSSRPVASADGKFLTLYGRGWPGETAVQVWNIAVGWNLRTMRGHRAGVRAVAFDRRDQLWTATGDGTIYQWDATAEAEPFSRFNDPGFDYGPQLAVNPDCTRLLVARNLASWPRIDRRDPPPKAEGPPGIMVLDWAGKVSHIFQEHQLPVKAYEFLPGGIEAASLGLARDRGGPAEAELLLWNTTTGKVRLKLAVPGAYPATVGTVAPSGDGQRLAVEFHRFGNVAGVDGLCCSMQVHDVATGNVVLTAPEQLASWVPDSAGFSGDGKWLVGPGPEYGVNVWSLATGREQWSIQAKGWRAQGAAFTPSGAQLAVWGLDILSGRSDLRLYAAATGQELRKLPGKVGGVGLVQFSADGKWLAMLSRSADADQGALEDVVRVLDAATWEERFALRIVSGMIVGLAFTPDGKRLATASTAFRPGDDAVKLWDLTTGQELLSLPRSCEALRFSSDGLRLAGLGRLPTSDLGAQPVPPAGLPKMWDATPLAK